MDEASAFKKPLNLQIKLMRDQIVQVKELLKKASDLKKDLKYDISVLNDDIDGFIDLIAEQFDISVLNTYRNEKTQLIHDQIDLLKKLKVKYGAKDTENVQKSAFQQV